MPQNYFNKTHFELLNKWKGTVYDKNNEEQYHAYEELCEAYNVTKRWAEEIKQKLFKNGWSKTVRRPIDQWHKKFIPYNWGRIYPSNNAPEGLAYTVGISAEFGFVVKIDLVDIKINDSALRKKFETIFGLHKQSSIVATKSVEEGLALDLTELVAWSIDSIQKFRPTYDEVAKELGLSGGQDQENLLLHFQGHEDFTERQPLWSVTTLELFIRLARAVNEMGLDWWFTRATNSQLRFGRKEKGTIKGRPVGWLFLRKDGIRVSCSAFSGLDELESADLTNELVQLFESADKDEVSWPAKLGAQFGRNGYWPDDYDIEDVPKNDNSSKNIIYYGPPGTGKTFKLQKLIDKYEDRYSLVTFHQSYGYEEFVEGLRPVITEGGNHAEDNEITTVSHNEVRYEIIPGAFLRLCKRARNNPSQQYAIAIDEINRGNISKIFGELITLIEADKRDPLDGTKPPIELTLAYSRDKFSVPANVDIIGAMNTADRSLALLDTALRRRFDFVPLLPDTRAAKLDGEPESAPLAGLIVTTDDGEIDVRRMLELINKRIEALYDRDHCIGHAYFTRLKGIVDGPERFDALADTFRNRVLPLLEEYFFEDWQKIRLVLGDNQKPKQEHQFVHEIDREEDLLALFGREPELDQYGIRSRYELNAAAFDEPDAYIGIYATNPDVVPR